MRTGIVNRWYHNARVVLGGLLCVSVIATGSTAGGGVKEADKAFKQQQYAVAADLYSQFLQLKPHNAKAHLNLGICYLELQEPEKAKEHLLKAQKLKVPAREEVVVYLAEAQHQTYAFEEAERLYKRALARANRKDQQFLLYLQKRINECIAGAALAGLPPSGAVANIGGAINSHFPDYVPVLLQQDSIMLYTSFVPAAHDASARIEQIRVSEWAQGSWQPSSLFLKPQDKLPHHAVVSVAPGGDELFTYYVDKVGGLYSSKRKDNTWSEPEKLGYPFNRGNMEPSVYVTEDGRFAFFASDREGGYGGLDIYICYRQPDGSWSDALNMGPSVNTAYNEDAPFVDSQTNTLYFSSQGHNSVGGFDIFKSSIHGSVWSAAENLGFPINSPADDLYFILSRDRKRGFFASDRPGGFGEKDIYEVKLP